MFIKSATTHLQVIFSVLGTIALAMVLLFPYEILSILFLLIAYAISFFAFFEDEKLPRFCDIKTSIQKLE